MEGNDLLLEWARLDTSSSVPCWGACHERSFVGDLLSVAAETCVAPVEDGRLLWIGGPFPPVPVLFEARGQLLTLQKRQIVA